METQTTILNLVTSAKNQKKTLEKLQKLNVPQQQQQNLRSQHNTNIFYANTIIAKININLSMTFSNERSNTK